MTTRQQNHTGHAIATAIAAMFALTTGFVACSESDNTHVTTGGDTPHAETYDSVFSKEYDLYIIDDDTSHDQMQHDDGPLTAEEKAIQERINDYAADMLDEYCNDSDGDNTILAPTNASMLYGMMSNFVDEQEQENAFKEALGINGADNKDINSYFNKCRNSTQNEPADDGAETEIAYTSNLWMDNKVAVYNSFISKTRLYGFGVKGMNVELETFLDDVNKTLDAQIGIQGGGIPKTALTEKAKPLVTSSMTFTGKWKDGIAVDSTKTYLFTNANGTTTRCNMLRTTAKRRYAHFDTFDMVEIPYKGDAYSMFVMLPQQPTGLQASIAELRKRGMARCMTAAADTTHTFHGVHFTTREATYYPHNTPLTVTVTDTLITDTIFNIRIPMFSLCSSTSLNPAGKNISSAVKRMYQTNLPKVAPAGFKLSDVFQSCRFEVNKEGTKASSQDSLAVVTEKVTTITNGSNPKIEIDNTQMPRGRKNQQTVIVNFYATHPFAIFIRNNSMGNIPFVCSIKNMDGINIK